MSDLITYSSWLMTAVSLTVAYFQFIRTKKITERSKQELLGFIKQSNHVSVELDLIQKGVKKFPDATTLRHLTSAHQAGSELYQNLVNYYLSLEDLFTYDDLRKICKTPIISYKWQEDCWRSFICLREENKKTDIPDEHYIGDRKSSRPQNQIERDIEPKQMEDQTT